MIIKERYTIEELASRWKCTKDDILWEIRNNRLSAVVEENYQSSTNTLILCNYVLSVEVERYERLRLQDPANNDSDALTDVQLVNQLKQEGKSDKQIAHELKRKFPKTNPSRVGKLITEIPGRTVTTDAYRKRGKKLLE